MKNLFVKLHTLWKCSPLLLVLVAFYAYDQEEDIPVSQDMLGDLLEPYPIGESRGTDGSGAVHVKILF